MPRKQIPDLLKNWSGRRDSNPRPRPWQGRALPLSYTRIRRVVGRTAVRRQAMPKDARLCKERGEWRVTNREGSLPCSVLLLPLFATRHSLLAPTPPHPPPPPPPLPP